MTGLAVGFVGLGVGLPVWLFSLTDLDLKFMRGTLEADLAGVIGVGSATFLTESFLCKL